MKKKTIFIAFGGSWTNQARVPMQFRELALKLEENGYKVVSIIQGMPDPQLVDEKDIFYWPSKRPTRLSDAFFFINLVNRFKPSLLITQWAATNIMLIIGWIMRVPHRVVWYHTLSKQIEIDWKSSPNKLKYLRFRKSLVYRLATCIAFVSGYAQIDFNNIYFKPTNAIIFYNGMKKESPSCNTQAENKLVICCVARLDHSKGQDILLQALKFVIEMGVEAKLLLVGSGPMQDQLVEICRNLGIDDNIGFEGSVSPSEVLEKLKSASLSILPSRMDNCPFAVVESINLGVPVIASNVGGIPEIIRDGIDGFLVPPENPVVLAEKIVLLLTDHELRKKMGENAHIRFENFFELSKVVNDQFEWIEKILN